MAGKADGKVTISTALDNNGLRRGINNISGSLGGLKSVLGKIGGAVAAAFAVQKLVQFGAACVKLGSDVAEVQNVVDVAFGSMAYKMEEFADTAIMQFGMSQLAAKKTGSTYMAMAKGMGMAEDAASDMAIALTGLTGDVASFFNISQEEADTKLKSVFTGETETLKGLGVVMTQQNLKQYALTHGLNSNIEAMTQAEQVALRYAFVTDALALASGDFARTQDSWANQTRILSMRWQEFMSVIGQALTTILLPVVKVLNAIVAALINMANTFNAVVQSIFGGAAKQIKDTGAAAAQANAAMGTSAGTAANGEDELANATKKAGKAANGASTSIDELNVVQQNTGEGAAVPIVPGASSGSAGGLKIEEQEETVPPLLAKIKEMLADLNTLFGPSLTAWGRAFENLKKPISDAFTVIHESATGLWNGALKPLGTYILTEFIPNIVNGFSETFAPIFSDVLTAAVGQWALNFQLACQLVGDAINTFVLPLLQLLEDVVLGMFSGISNAWNEYGAPILAAWEQQQANLRALWESLYYGVIQPILEGIMTELTWLWDEHIKPLWDNLMLFFGAFAEMVLTLWNERIYPMIQNFVTIFGPQIAGVVEFIVSSFSTAVAIIGDLINGVVQIMRGLCDFLTGVFTGNWKKAWKGIQEIFGGVWTAIEGIFKGVVNGIIGAINFMIRAVVRAVNFVIDALNKISVDIPDWAIFGDLAGKTFGFNFSPMPEYQIPKLAQGAVLPANKPFLAMVGDQKRGTSVEAPVETIQQAVAEVLARMGGAQEFTASAPIEVSLDGEVLYRAMERIRAGRGAEIGGVFANAY